MTNLRKSKEMNVNDSNLHFDLSFVNGYLYYQREDKFPR